MNKLIAKEQLIERSKKEGVDFGSGSAYNRLRYYTKLGWIPHMGRQKDTEGKVTGHYPAWTIDRLKYIQKLKNKNFSNEKITQKLKKLKAKRNLLKSVHVLKTPEKRNQLVAYISFIILLIILGTELGIIPIGKTKNSLIYNTVNTKNVNTPNQILDSGNNTFPKNKNILFVESNNVTESSKIFITFKNNISPATNYWIGRKVPYNGFYIELDKMPSLDSDFSWWITN